MLWRQDTLESVGTRCQPGSRFSRSVGGVIVQDQTDRTRWRIPGVQILQQSDELNAPMTLLDPRDDMTVEQVETRKNRPCAMPDVLMIAGESRMHAGDGR